MDAQKLPDTWRGGKNPLKMLPATEPAANSGTEREPLVWSWCGADRQPTEFSGERRKIRACGRLVFNGDVHPASTCIEIVESARVVRQGPEMRRDDQDPLNQVSPCATPAAGRARAHGL